MAEDSRERLIVFTRYPKAGTTKTRMIPELGAGGAAELQRQMTEHILSRANILGGLHPLPVEIRYEGGSERLMTEWLGPGFYYCHQGSGDIGLRMARALQDAFGQGCETAVIIGSDIPDITTNIMQKAFEALKQSDLVLGPAADGGYYLIGVHRRTFKHCHPQLFSDISWGTENVLPQTLHIAERLGINYSLLDTLMDVDRPEDLSVWYHAADLEPPTTADNDVFVAGGQTALTSRTGWRSADLSNEGHSLLVHALDAEDADTVRDEIKELRDMSMGLSDRLAG